MTREEFIEQHLKPLIVKMERDSIILMSPEEYARLKKDFNFTDEDVKRWAKGDLE